VTLPQQLAHLARGGRHRLLTTRAQVNGAQVLLVEHAAEPCAAG
jgi:hypothetical protein